MNEDYDMDFPVEAVPDDLEQYLKNIELMKRLTRINRAVAAFSDRNSFSWHYEHGSVLPEDQRAQINDLLNIGYGLRFSSMDSNLKQILWKGVRFYYGLSANDFPFPDALKDKAEPLAQPSANAVSRVSKSSVRLRPPLAAFIFAGAVAFMLGIVVESEHERQHLHRDSSIPSAALLQNLQAGTQVQRATAEPKLENVAPPSQSQQ